jgi:uncharacterized phiE125 gp8 family phage protein
MSMKLITAPSVNPVDSATVKAHLRVIGSSEDALITIYTDAATQALDGPNGLLGRALVTQTWEYVLDKFPSAEIKMPLPPIQTVTFVKYLDESGVEQTLDSARYQVDTAGDPGWIVVDADGWPATMDTANAVTIRFVAGYGLAAAVPAPIKSAILLHVGDLFENRQIGAEKQLFVNDAYDRLTYPYRKLGL